MALIKVDKEKTEQNIRASTTFYQSLVRTLVLYDLVAVNLLTGEYKRDGFFICIADYFDSVEVKGGVHYTKKFVDETLCPLIDKFIQSHLTLLCEHDNYLTVYTSTLYINLDICKWCKERDKAISIAKKNVYFYGVMDSQGFSVPF